MNYIDNGIFCIRSQRTSAICVTCIQGDNAVDWRFETEAIEEVSANYVTKSVFKALGLLYKTKYFNWGGGGLC